MHQHKNEKLPCEKLTPNQTKRKASDKMGNLLISLLVFKGI